MYKNPIVSCELIIQLYPPHIYPLRAINLFKKALTSLASTSFNRARSTSLSRPRSSDHTNYARALFRAYIIAPAIFAPDDLLPPFSTPVIPMECNHLRCLYILDGGSTCMNLISARDIADAITTLGLVDPIASRRPTYPKSERLCITRTYP